jgi:hypothetical protein
MKEKVVDFRVARLATESEEARMRIGDLSMVSADFLKAASAAE